MGSGFALCCPGCHYKIKVRLGVGFLYYSLQNVIGQVHPRRRPAMMEILKNHQGGEADYRHALYRCRECGGLYNRFYVRISHDGNKLYQTIFRCPKCKTNLEEVPEDINFATIRCPLCKKRNLEVKQHLLWD